MNKFKPILPIKCTKLINAPIMNEKEELQTKLKSIEIYTGFNKEKILYNFGEISHIYGFLYNVFGNTIMAVNPKNIPAQLFTDIGGKPECWQIGSQNGELLTGIYLSNCEQYCALTFTTRNYITIIGLKNLLLEDDEINLTWEFPQFGLILSLEWLPPMISRTESILINFNDGTLLIKGIDEKVISRQKLFAEYATFNKEKPKQIFAILKEKNEILVLDTENLNDLYRINVNLPENSYLFYTKFTSLGITILASQTKIQNRGRDQYIEEMYKLDKGWENNAILDLTKPTLHFTLNRSENPIPSIIYFTEIPHLSLFFVGSTKNTSPFLFHHDQNNFDWKVTKVPNLETMLYNSETQSYIRGIQYYDNKIEGYKGIPLILYNSEGDMDIFGLEFPEGIPVTREAKNFEKNSSINNMEKSPSVTEISAISPISPKQLENSPISKFNLEINLTENNEKLYMTPPKNPPIENLMKEEEKIVKNEIKKEEKLENSAELIEQKNLLNSEIENNIEKLINYTNNIIEEYMKNCNKLCCEFKEKINSKQISNMDFSIKIKQIYENLENNRNFINSILFENYNEIIENLINQKKLFLEYQTNSWQKRYENYHFIDPVLLIKYNKIKENFENLTKEIYKLSSINSSIHEFYNEIQNFKQKFSPLKIKETSEKTRTLKKLSSEEEKSHLSAYFTNLKSKTEKKISKSQQNSVSNPNIFNIYTPTKENRENLLEKALYQSINFWCEKILTELSRIAKFPNISLQTPEKIHKTPIKFLEATESLKKITDIHKKGIKFDLMEELADEELEEKNEWIKFHKFDCENIRKNANKISEIIKNQYELNFVKTHIKILGNNEENEENSDSSENEIIKKSSENDENYENEEQKILPKISKIMLKEPLEIIQEEENSEEIYTNRNIKSNFIENKKQKYKF